MTDVWAPTPGRPYVTDTYSQAVGITNTRAIPDNTFGPTYQGARGPTNVLSYGAYGDGVHDDTTAIQAALDLKGEIYFPPGRYYCTAPLKFYEDTTVRGAGLGSTSLTTIAMSYSGASFPIQIMGTNTANGTWVYNLLLENIYFDAGGWTGSADAFMNVSGAYSCDLRKFTIDTPNYAKAGLRISKVNDLTVTARISHSVTDLTLGIDVTSTDGAVNLLRLINCDVELCTTGVKFTGTTNAITCDILSHYTEENDTAIDWNSSNAQSKLTMIGGYLDSPSGSTGVKIRQSNVTLLGVGVTSTATYGVDLAGASSHQGIHILGGIYVGGVNDPSNYATLNNTTKVNVGGGDVRGSATGTGGSMATTGVAVAFDYGMEDATYFVNITGNANETFWIQAASKTAAGFTINSSNATSTATIDWSIRN